MPVKAYGRDARDIAPVGTYLAYGKQLVWVIEADNRAVIAEDAVTGDLVKLGVTDLMQRWKRIEPLAA